MGMLVRKISPATVCADKLRRLDTDGSPKEVILYDVYGVTNRIKQGKTDKGDWLQFRGQFEAMAEDGETLSSGACFLPQPFEDMLYSELTKVLQADPNGSVRFACRVSIVPPPKGKPSATGYEYRCEPLIDQEQDSPLMALRQLVNERRKLLASGA